MSLPAALTRGIALAAAGILALGLSSCSGGSDDAKGDGDGLGTISVGALPVPAGDMLTWVNDNLGEEAGLEIKVREYTDYNTPNPGLSDGSDDANLFQNETFLENYNEQTGDDLISLGKIYLPAAAYYSNTVDSLDDLEDGAKVAIPNDPTNEGRALEMLAAEGIIEISDGATTLADITDNPKNLKFIEIENASLGMAVPDNDATFATASFALPAGLTGDQAILIEGTDSNYYNVLATRPELKDDPRVQKLLELLTDQQTKDYILDTWQGLIVPVD